MRSLGQMLAAICAVLFVVGSVVVLLIFNIEAQAFSSRTYKQAFEDQQLYERMPAILASALTSYIAENGSAYPFLQVLTAEDWQNNVTLLLPPEELRGIASNALDATFDYLNGRTDSVVIFIAPIKLQLAGEPGIQLVLQILGRQPACTPEQLTQMALGLFEGQIALCNPPQEALAFILPFIQSQVQAVAAVIPNELTLLSSVASPSVGDPRDELKTLRSAIRLTPLIPALLLLGIAVFAARSLAAWLTWWGWSFMFAGGASALVGLFGSPVIGGILKALIQIQGRSLIPPVLASAIAETASAVARQMLVPVIVQGLILGVLGLGMVVVAALLTGARRPATLQTLGPPRV